MCPPQLRTQYREIEGATSNYITSGNTRHLAITELSLPYFSRGWWWGEGETNVFFYTGGGGGGGLFLEVQIINHPY